MIHALEKEEKSLEYSLLEFLEEYQFHHSDEKTMRLVQAILSKKEVSILTEGLKCFGKEELSKELERLIIEKAYDKEYQNYHLDKFLPILASDKKVKPSYKLKKVAITGSIIAMTTLTSISGFLFSSYSKNKSRDTLKQSTITHQVASTNTTTHPQEENLSTTQESIEELQKKKEELLKAEKKRLEKEKQRVLNTFSKCDTIKKIKKRQKELENLKLTDKDKLYQKCPLSPALQHFIYEQSIVNGYPPDLMIAIIDTETRGKFDSSGIASYNEGNNTYDLGLTQQNSKESLLNFCKVYNIRYKPAYKLVQNNDYVNVCSAFLEFKEISTKVTVFDPYEYAGHYNYWIRWKTHDGAVYYVELFTNAYDNIYTKYHQVEQKKVLTKTKKK